MNETVTSQTAMLVERLKNLGFNKRKELFRILADKGINPAELPIVPMPTDAAAVRLLPASYAQERLWFLWQLEPQAHLYNIPTILQLKGDLDVEILQKSFTAIVARHEVLRTTFFQEDRQLQQVIHPTIALPFSEENIEGDDKNIEEIVQAEVEKSFDLHNGPLFRIALFHCDAHQKYLVLTQHHIISDAWSMQLLVEEFSQFYVGFLQQQPITLDVLPVQYSDYSAWQQQWLDAGERQRQQDYWVKALGDISGVLALPTDYPRPPVPSHRGAQIKLKLDGELASELKAFAQQHQCSVFSLLLLAFQLLLQRYSGQDDIAVGVPFANRNRPEIENLLGFFVNTLVLRNRLDDRHSPLEALKKLKLQLVEAQTHQDLPFEQLVDVLRPERSLSHSPLFQVMFNYQFVAADHQRRQLPGLAVNWLENKTIAAKFDLALDVAEFPHGIDASFTFAVDVFKESTIAIMANHWVNLLRALVQQPQRALADISMLDEHEQHQVLHNWNAQVQRPAETRCVHELFEARVLQAPAAEAMVFHEQSLTYAQLNAWSNRLAHRLRDLGIGPEVRVGIAFERAPEMIVSLLAVLKAGGAYVPLDPAYPADRLAYMMDDSGIELLLTQEHLQAGLAAQHPALPILCVSADGNELGAYPAENPGKTADIDNLAYLIYTSGSTGKPKGVAVTQGPLAMHCVTIAELYGMRPDDRELQFASINFDGAHERWLVPLTSGATLMIRDNDMWSVERTAEEIARHGITIACFTPSYLLQMAETLGEAGSKLPIRSYTVGGEGTTKPVFDFIQKVLQPPRIINGYGPTETVITPLLWRAYPDTTFDSQFMPIGNAVGGRSTYILDDSLRLAPISVMGELYIGGEGLARGYFNRPALTAERFIPDPFAAEPGGRLYRTGDLAKYRTDGVIEYAGRIDHQVKVRGFRIELGEIEARLHSLDSVLDAVVITQETATGNQLVAYVVPQDTLLALDTVSIEARQQWRSNVKAELQSMLPDYMVPAYFVLLAELPLTPAGKLDRKGLPPIDASEAQQTYVAPQSELEQQLAAIWQSVLGLEQVGLNDNFFELGGHSLLVTQVISRVRKELQLEIPLRSVFEAAELGNFAKRVEQLQAASTGTDTIEDVIESIKPVSRENQLPLSYAQQRQWVLWQLDPHSSAYHMSSALRLQGELDISALETSFALLIKRHEVLRTHIAQDDAGNPYQQIEFTSGFRLERESLPAAFTDAQLQQRLATYSQQPFDLHTGPLLKACLFTFATGDYVLALVQHHIISDAWSMGRMVEELVTTYAALVAGKEPELPTLPIQYADYAVWQRERLSGAEGEKQLAYWKGQLGDEQPLLELPLDHPRPLQPSYQGRSHAIILDQALLAGIERQSRTQGVTRFMWLLAAFQTLLHRYSGQADIRVGSPIANRTRLETEHLLGFFVNTQVLRAQFEPDMSFEGLLTQVRTSVLEAQAHQDLPFEQLVEVLQPERSLSHSPLFQVMFNYLVQTTQQGGVQQLPGLSVEGVEWEHSTAQFDLTLDVSEGDGKLYCRFNYATDLFEADTIARLVNHWQQVIEQLLAQPQQRLAQLPLLSAVEQQQILKDWNSTDVHYGESQCIHSLIEAQAEQSATAIAVTGLSLQSASSSDIEQQVSLSYFDLNTKANQLAHYLRTQGVGPDVLVGIAVERSVEMVIGLLAILKAGGAYVPLDPEYPSERIAYMIENSNINLLLTQSSLKNQLPIPAHVETVLLDGVLSDSTESIWNNYSTHNLTNNTQPSNLAYVIYTSGSTGKPKGTLLPHRNVSRLFDATQHWFSFGKKDVWTMFHSYAFDFSVWEIFGALVYGGRLVIVPFMTSRSPDAFWKMLEEEKVTVLNQTPSAFRQLMQVAINEGQTGNEGQTTASALRYVIFGGEALELESLQPWFNRFGDSAPQLINMYGITETTVHVTYRPLTRDDKSGSPIGQVIPDLSWYVLDGELNPVMRGGQGELHVGQAGLARGYLKRGGLTAERFIPDPFAREPGGRLYRTGDLARYRADGVIEYAGRIDHQVKIRGFRIELGEIETQLHLLDSIRDVAVLAVDIHNSKQLVAYLVPQDASLLATEHTEARQQWRSDIKTALQAVLPDYMVPAHLVLLEQLPLTPNGKLDRKALPAVDVGDAQQTYVAPQTILEQQLAAIWQSVLGIEQVGLNDNFFELGGDSIIALQLVSRARQAGIQFNPKDVFQHQTLQALGQVSREVDNDTVKIDQGPVTGTYPLTPIQSLFFERAIPDRHHWNQAVLLQPREPLDAGLLQQAIQQLLVHHDALRLRFKADEAGQWQGEFAPVDSSLKSDVFWQRRVADDAALSAEATLAQASLDLTKGPLLRVVLFQVDTDKLANSEQRVLIAVHHLAIDGVSWRILLEDLQQAYRQLQQGKVIQLPPKSSSFKAWAEQLQGYASTTALHTELTYWQQLAAVNADLPQDHPEGSLSNAYARQVSTRLDKTLTQRLLKGAPVAYRTQVNDLLLTALARVICRWSGEASTLVALEGHGREDLFDGLDITRTVGWFTSLFPVKLTLASNNGIGEAIKAVKEQLRTVPNKGLGYGLLRYLGDEQSRALCEALPEARITFNYLGQFDGSFGEDQGSLFVPAQENGGINHSEEAPLDNWLSINGQVYNGTLELNWTFSGEMYRDDTVQGLADALAEELTAIIAHCAVDQPLGVTPSDFPLLSITQPQLDQLPVVLDQVEDIYPLAPMQQGMLFHSLNSPEEGAYLNQMQMQVQGLEVERFRAAWQGALNTHASLRAGFLWEGVDEPVQVIYRQATLPFQVHDASALAATELTSTLASLAQQRRTSGFDFATSPLLSLDVIRLPDANGQHTHHLIFTNHHILLDGWSTSQLFGEILQRYAGEVPAQPVGSYRDYLAWLQDRNRTASETFWKGQLASLDEPTLLGNAIGRPAVDEGRERQGECQALWPVADTRDLTAFAKANKVTVNTVLQAAWLLLLQRYTGQDVVAFGATVAGRPTEINGIEQQLGLFINTLPVIAQPRATQSISDWLQQVQQQNLQLRDYEHTPLYEIQRWAGQGGNTLFDSILVFENYPVSEALQEAPGGLLFSGLHNHEQTHYGLTLVVALGEQLSITFRYDRTQFADAVIKALAEHWQSLLAGFMTNAHQALGNLPLLNTQEQQQIAKEWNATEVNYGESQCIHSLIEAQADASATAIAVTGLSLQSANRSDIEQQVSLSYSDLNTKANQLAHYLRTNGVGPDVLVGIAVERSVEMVIGLLAILKAGGAYVPLDPEYPSERIAYMMENSGIGLLLTQSSLQNQLPIPAAVQTVLLDDVLSDSTESIWNNYSTHNPTNHTLPSNLAYVIYTSGSTGKPKGVAIAHRNTFELICWSQSVYRRDDLQGVLAATSICFDLSVWELFVTLGSGGHVIVAENALALASHPARDQVRLVNTVPSAIAALAQANAIPASVKTINLAGEALSQALVDQLYGMGVDVVYDLYGPSEDTTYSTYTRRIAGGKPDIGRPISNTQTYILDNSLQPVPVGVVGELYIAGAGLAQGYLNKPQLTADKFLPNPFSTTGERFYRTGDLARYRADGVIEYAGRIDYQVKIRGFRIELGEIDAQLHALEAVRDVAVIALDTANGKQLVAYLVPQDASLVATEHTEARQQWRADIKTALQAVLPDYMVPAHLVLLEQLPLTPNGKLDRKALPAVDASEAQQAYVAPQSELEQQLAAVWQSVLGVEQIGLNDNFFELGGHSLLVTQVISRVRKELQLEIPLRSLFEASVLKEFANRVTQLQRESTYAIHLDDIKPISRNQSLPLSYAQQRQWVLWQLDSQSAAYHINTALRLTGTLDVVALEQSFIRLAQRHEILRTRIGEDNQGKPVQIIEPDMVINLERESISAISDQQLQQRLATYGTIPFDLHQGPLLRALLIDIAKDADDREYVLALVQHHVISDAWSMRRMVEELVVTYTALVAGKEPELPTLPIQYADYAVWQRERLAGAEGEKQLAYWKGQLGHEHPVLDLPFDHKRPLHQSYRGANVTLSLASDILEKLDQHARSKGVTRYMWLLAAFQVFLHRYSGQSDIRVGTPVANRTRLETEHLLGVFVNTQVMRAQFTQDIHFEDLLEQVRQVAMEAQAHQDLPFEQLVDALQPERSLSHSPLFQVLFNYLADQRQHTSGSRLSGLQVESIQWERTFAQFDLTLEIADTTDAIHLSFNYATDLFEAGTIERLVNHWQFLLRQLLEQPQQRLAQLPLLSAVEQQQILKDWNSTDVHYGESQCIHSLIETQAKNAGDAIAVTGPGLTQETSATAQHISLSYSDLNTKANQLAHYLRVKGVGPDVLVGIAVERSVEMVIGLLAILKAGGAYVPLDPEYPSERIAYMIENSNINLLLTQSSLQNQLPIPMHVETVLLDDVLSDSTESIWNNYSTHNPTNHTLPSNLAYVIYTSGSTGKPKGVAIAHRNTFELIRWSQSVYRRDDLQGVLAATSICFDLSVWELFVTLGSGGHVIVAENALALASHPARDQVRLVNTVPSAIAALAQANAIPASVKTINLAGEALSQALVDQLYGMGVDVVYDLYGPSEDTTYSTYTRRIAGGKPDIGRPISNTQTYILDNSLQPVPVGVVGELYIAGAGLAQGYLNKPQLTADKFLPNPFSTTGERFYRTGDLARYRADGVIEYAGRIDYQVKIRGFRIELGEIDAQLHALEAVRDVAVIALDTANGKQLVAYLVPQDASLVATEHTEARQQWRADIKTALQAVLPDYMVPAHLVLLEQLPLTPNGKLDRKALPAVDASEAQQAYVAPQSEIEQQLAAIWQSVLGLEQVGLNDNFFELGGDSIIALQLVSRARQAGIQFNPKDVFQHQTLQALGQVSREVDNDTVKIDQGPVTGTYPLTPIQSAFFSWEIPTQHHWNQSVLLQPGEPLDARLLQQALHQVVIHHDALRLRFQQDEQGQWQGEFAPVDEVLEADVFWQRRVADEASLTTESTRAQASLDLTKGPLLRVVLFQVDTGQSANSEQRLLIAVHHLAIDGVSWRILLEDLQQAYRQLQQGNAIQLPPKTSSFKAWAKQLRDYAGSAELHAELEYWQQLAAVNADLPQDNPEGELSNKQARHVSTRLDKTLTQRLLKEAPAAYRTQVNDLLLTALARVICRWSGEASTLIALEGHGREDLFEGLDITRTLGWFTSLFPVKLTLASNNDIGEAIKAVKEQLRAVPNKGLGYGLLRYLGDEQTRRVCESLPEARITFNYLGQFDSSFGEGQGSLFVPAQENGGTNHSEHAPLENWLSINGQVYNGTLELNWTFSGEMYRDETIQQLADALGEELKAIIAHCAVDQALGVTPSDFPLLSISQSQLDQLPLALDQVEDIYPLSPMQQGMLFHSLNSPDDGAYLNQMQMQVQGLEVERFRAAWQATLNAHASLRAGFLWEGVDEPVQVIYRRVELPFQVHDASALATTELTGTLASLAQQRRTSGFDFAAAPLLSLDVIRLPDANGQHTHHLIFTNHHILLDGWSTSQLFGEILQRYAGETPTQAASSYRDYLAWLGDRNQVQSETFWKEQLASLDEPTLLGNAVGRPVVDEGFERQGEYQTLLSVADTRALTAFAKANKVTVNTVLQAAWLLLLQRYTGQEVVAFGATVAGRSAEINGIEQQLGLFINTLPVIAQPTATQTVGDWLQQVQQQNLQLRDYEHTPLYEIQRWAGQGGTALFDSILVFENYPVSEALQEAPGGLLFSGLHNHEQTHYGLTLVVALGEQLSITFRYDRTQFSDTSANNISQQLQRILSGFLENGSGIVGNIHLLKSDEEQQVLADWNASTRDFGDGECIHTLIEAQAAQAGESLAVTGPSLVGDSVSLSYEKLNAHANQLAHYLRENGVGPDVLVGVAVERSVEMIVGLLAILKAGGAYVPLDPDYPVERLAYMMENSGIDLLLTQASLRDQLPIPDAVKSILIDGVLANANQFAWSTYPSTNLPNLTLPANLAYVIYTSGSTGKPKGALLPHQNVCRLFKSTEEWFHFDKHDVWTMFHSFAFDFSVWEIFGALMYGGRLLIVPFATSRSPDEFHEMLIEEGVTVLNQTPSAFRQLTQIACDDNAPASTGGKELRLRYVIFGGEALDVESLQPWFARFGEASPQLVNMYGITETTVHVTYKSLSLEDKSGSPIGEVIPDLTWYVLDGEGHPIGAENFGELHVGQAGLARGYHQRPGLTAERFIPDPFAAKPGGRLYRTGDLACYRTNGVIEYAGRIDHQVKIRGFRIELGEIDAQLHALESVRDVAVLAVDLANDKQLVAYVVPQDSHLVEASTDIEARNHWRNSLRAELLSVLPGYMVPTHFVLLDKLPLTANGKLDRKALPSVDAGEMQGVWSAPVTLVEQQLAEIWQSVLGIEQVGVNDNFFELGGHSILLIQTLTRIKNQWHVEISPKDFYVAGSIKELAQLIDSVEENSLDDDFGMISSALDELEECDV